MASSISSTRLSPIILKSTANWDRWLEEVEDFAREREILHLIDLTKTEQPAHRSEPTRPTLNREFPSPAPTMPDVEMEVHEILYRIYERQMAPFNDESKAIQELVTFINSTVAKPNLNEIRDTSTTPWALLLELKRRLAPLDYAREMKLSRQWIAQKKAPKPQQVENWLFRWEHLYAQGSRLNAPEVHGDRAVFDFVIAVKAIDPGWANPCLVMFELQEMEGVPLPSFGEVVALFRDRLRLAKYAPQN